MPGRDTTISGRVTRIYRSIFTRIINFIYPPLCILCDSSPESANSFLCRACINTLFTNNQNRHPCSRCGQNKRYHSCSCEIAWDHPFERVYALFDFDEHVQRLIHEIKYQGKKRLAFELGRRFAGCIPHTISSTIDCIAAVPLHPLRNIKRGYNQSALLAQGVAAGLSGTYPVYNRSIKRTRNTRTQTKLDRTQRRKNLANAFAVHKKHQSELCGKTVLLVDDVVTTGTTTSVCTSTLLHAGCSKVFVLALARA